MLMGEPRAASNLVGKSAQESRVRREQVRLSIGRAEERGCQEGMACSWHGPGI